MIDYVDPDALDQFGPGPEGIDADELLGLGAADQVAVLSQMSPRQLGCVCDQLAGDLAAAKSGKGVRPPGVTFLRDKRTGRMIPQRRRRGMHGLGEIGEMGVAAAQSCTPADLDKCRANLKASADRVAALQKQLTDSKASADKAIADLTAQRDQARKNLATAQANVKHFGQKNAGTQQQLDAAKAQLATAQAQLTAAQTTTSAAPPAASVPSVGPIANSTPPAGTDAQMIPAASMPTDPGAQYVNPAYYGDDGSGVDSAGPLNDPGFSDGGIDQATGNLDQYFDDVDAYGDLGRLGDGFDFSSFLSNAGNVFQQIAAPVISTVQAIRGKSPAPAAAAPAPVPAPAPQPRQSSGLAIAGMSGGTLLVVGALAYLVLSKRGRR